MFIARLAISGLLFVFFALGAGANLWILLKGFRRTDPSGREHHVSMIPFLAGVVGAIAVWISPFPRLRYFAWLPLVLDLGCLPAIAMALLAMRRDK